MPSEPTHIFECPECGEKQEGKRGLYGHFQQNHPDLRDDWDNIKENVDSVEEVKEEGGVSRIGNTPRSSLMLGSTGTTITENIRP